MPTIGDIWAGLSAQSWWIRSLIGMLIGGFLFAIVPAIVAKKPVSGSGGAGGSAKVGGRGMAIGGDGGAGGPGAAGGAGGSGSVVGDGFAMGGEGGEAGQRDRGGRGGRSPLEVMHEKGIKSSDTLKAMGAPREAIEFNMLMESVQQEFLREHPDQTAAVLYELKPLPEAWTNEALKRRGVKMRYTVTDSGWSFEKLQ